MGKHMSADPSEIGQITAMFIADQIDEATAARAVVDANGAPGMLAAANLLQAAKSRANGTFAND